MNSSQESTVLPETLSSGPKGLGDPSDRTLRKVETEILIPKIMREIARKEKCTQFVKAFEECCKNSSVLMVWKCRTENNTMKSCLTDWYNNDSFRNQCQDIYLKQRQEYRLTGHKEKTKRFS